MLVFKCELCGQEEDRGFPFYADHQYCSSCNELLQRKEIDIRTLIHKDYRERMCRAERNRVHILELCEYLYKYKRTTFRRYFGKEGEEMLLKAVQK